MGTIFSAGDIVVSRYGERYYLFEGKTVEKLNGSVTYYSVIAEYDPKKCTRTKEGWGFVEHFDVASVTNQLAIPSDREDVTYRLANEREKAKFLDILDSYGYFWDAKTSTLTEIDGGEVVHTVVMPKTEYNGEVISPLSGIHQEMLKNFCTEKNMDHDYSHSYAGYGYNYHNYGDYWE
jgi:hypothetical protein